MSEDIDRVAERRAAARERVKRSRELRRDGYVGMVSLAIHRDEADALVRHGFLAEQDRGDVGAIADAIGKLLEHVFPGALGVDE
jgi:hypothetical protein